MTAPTQDSDLVVVPRPREPQDGAASQSSSLATVASRRSTSRRVTAIRVAAGLAAGLAIGIPVGLAAAPSHQTVVQPASPTGRGSDLSELLLRQFVDHNPGVSAPRNQQDLVQQLLNPAPASH